MKKVALCITATLASAGCQSIMTDTSTPAVLSVQSYHQTQALANAVSDLLFGRQVTLAKDAFRTSASVLIERNPTLDPQGRIIETAAEPAIEITLSQRDDTCWLTRVDTQDEIPLAQIQCQPLGN